MRGSIQELESPVLLKPLEKKSEPGHLYRSEIAVLGVALSKMMEYTAIFSTVVGCLFLNFELA